MENKVIELSFMSEIGDKYARIIIEQQGNVYDIKHTYVEEYMQGKSVASKLMEAAMQYIKEHNGKVKASCSYAQKWLDKHQ